MTILGPSIKKKDLSDFFQKMAMLLDTGYDSCSAVELLAFRKEGEKKKDHSADGVRAVAKLLLPSLEEGVHLHEAMNEYPKYFLAYSNQVEVGENSGRTAEVLQRISDQIKNESKITAKLKSALTYPAFVLFFTLCVAMYLFTNVVPEMLSMLASIGATQIPATTQMVMNIGTWFKEHGVTLGILLVLLITFLVIYGKTSGRDTYARLATSVPLVGKIVVHNSMMIFYRSWQQMIFAGAEMSLALSSASESAPNFYIRRLLTEAQRDYEENGIPVFEALKSVYCARELELQTIEVALQGDDKLTRVLGVLAEDREYEANRAIQTLTSAINPILMIIVGSIVAVLVFSIYEPIINVSSAL